MKSKCSACDKIIARTDGAICPQCSSLSHYECVGLPTRAKVAPSWRCGDCQSRTPKGRDPSTPVRGVMDGYTIAQSPPVAAAVAEAMILDDTAHNITTEFSEMELQLDRRSLRDEFVTELDKMQMIFLAELKSFREEFRTHSSEMSELRKEVLELRTTVSACNEKVTSLEKRVTLMEQAAVKNENAKSGSITTLEQTISELKSELNDREQESLLNDVEVTNLPEQKGESAVHIVSVLASAMGMSLDERDIVSAERLGAVSRQQQHGDSSQVAAVRTRKIVVRFARRSTRDEYLRAARVRRGLTSADVGVSETPPVRVYVNERLSRANRQLFANSREECRRHQWKYSWTKEGRIYVRREHGSPVTRIRNVKDLERVFGVGLV